MEEYESTQVAEPSQGAKGQREMESLPLEPEDAHQSGNAPGKGSDWPSTSY